MPVEEALTQRQLQILDVIASEVEARGFPPSIREIGERVGLSSSSTVHSHLRQLEEKGFIRRDPARPRCIEVLSNPQRDSSISTPEEAVIQSTSGIMAYPLLEAGRTDTVTVPLPRDLVGTDNAFLFQVEGDSMRDAAILHGDLVVAEKRSEVEDGDIVVALANHELTVKRYFGGSGMVRLEPDNRRMKPIFVRDVKILGKVVALIRRIY